MIKELTIYEVKGVRFDNLNDASRYEDLCDEIECIMSILQHRTKDVDNHKKIIKHDTDNLKKCLKEFYKLCSKYLPQHKRIFEEVSSGIRHVSHAHRIIEDNNAYYPIISDTAYRFRCINMETCMEFSQPYYANHPEEGLELINKYKSWNKNVTE